MGAALFGQGLGRVEQRTVADADDVAGDEFFFGVAEGFALCRLHGRVDALDADAVGHVFEGRVQDGDGTGRNGHALRTADEFAVEFRDDQADRLGCAGGVRNDVDRAGSCAAEVALPVRAVEDHLVAGVGMDGGHEAGTDFSVVRQDFGHRSEAVGGAARAADDVVVFGQGLVVDAVDDGRQVIAGRCGDQDLLGARVDVRLGLLFGCVEAGALEDDVDVEFLPGQVLCIGLFVDGDVAVVDLDAVPVRGNVMEIRIAALHRVILEQVREHLRIGQVVDRNDVDVLVLVHLAEGQASDAAEAVDCNSCHVFHLHGIAVLIVYVCLLRPGRMPFEESLSLRIRRSVPAKRS